MKTDKEFEDFFRDRFKDFEESPPDDAWEAIQPQIQKRKLPRSKIVGALVFFVAATLIPAVIFVYNPEQNNYFKKEGIDRSVTIQDKPLYKHLDKAPSGNDTSGYSSIPRKEGRDFQATETTTRKNIPAHDDNEKVDFLAEKERADKPSVASELPEKGVKEKNLTSSAVSDSFKQIKKEASKDAIGRDEDMSEQRGSRQKEYLVTKSNKRDAANESIDTNERNNQANFHSIRPDSSKPSPPSDSKSQYEISTVVIADSNKSKVVDLKAEADYSNASLKPISSLGIKASNSLTIIGLQFKPTESDFINKKEQPLIVVENKKAKTSYPTKKYDLQIFFSPRYSYRRITLNTNDEVYVQNVSGNKYFGERLGYEMGLVGSKNVTERLRLNLGLSFINLNEKLTYNSTEGKVGTLQIEEIKPNEFNINPVYKSDSITFKSVYYYTGLTLSTSYVYAASGRRTFYITVGGGVNLLVKGTTEKKVNGVNQSKVYFPSKKSPLEQMNFKLNFGPGYAYRISSKKELLIEPTINYYLGSTYKKREPLGLKPYTIGLNLGLRF